MEALEIVIDYINSKIWKPLGDRLFLQRLVGGGNPGDAEKRAREPSAFAGSSVPLPWLRAAMRAMPAER
jgi:hypothetical protein